MSYGLVLLCVFLSYSIVIFLSNRNDPIRRRVAIWPLIFGILGFLLSLFLNWMKQR